MLFKWFGPEPRPIDPAIGRELLHTISVPLLTKTKGILFENQRATMCSIFLDEFEILSDNPELGMKYLADIRVALGPKGVIQFNGEEQP